MINKKLFTCIFLFSVSVLNAAKEIELKMSIDAALYPVVEQWLAENAQYKGQTEQKEWYVINPEDSWDYSAGFKDTLKTMRVRQEAKGDSVCYKQCHLDPVTKRILYRDEFETKVQDGAVIVEILKLLGYTEHTIIQKKRSIYMVRDTFEVVLDDVIGLGKFIEVELKVPVDNVCTGITQIEGLIKEMGVTEFTEYTRSYIHMVWNPDYDFGIKRILK